MKMIDTAHIAYWPEEVMLGTAKISSELTLDILPDEELEVLNGFKNQQRKAEFLSTRHLFQFLLKEMNIDAQKVILKKEKNGKPFALLGENHLHVSFSHSSQKVFCAISQQKDVGLDVEHTSRNVSIAVLKRILNEREIALIGGEDPVKLWTMKEAAVKCMGTGLRTNLRDLTITKNKKKRFFVDFNNEMSFEICSFKQSDHQIALAY